MTILCVDNTSILVIEIQKPSFNREHQVTPGPSTFIWQCFLVSVVGGCLDGETIRLLPVTNTGNCRFTTRYCPFLYNRRAEGESHLSQPTDRPTVNQLAPLSFAAPDQHLAKQKLPSTSERTPDIAKELVNAIIIVDIIITPR